MHGADADTHHGGHALDRQSLAGLVAVGALLALCVVTGGSSQESGAGVFAAQLMSLPVLGWAGWRLLRGTHQTSPTYLYAWLAFAVVLFAIPALQALLPGSVAGGEGRQALAADLAQFGGGAPARWSLAPGASRDAAFHLLPGLAIFAMVLSLPHAAQRRLAQLVVALAIASLLLGLAQLGAPQESPLNPYPQWSPAMNGFFANPNHQATLLVVAATLACARLAMVVGAWPPGRPHRVVHGVVAALVMLLAAVALPLTGSRAGVVLIILACALVVLAHWPAWRGGLRSRAVLVASMAIAAAALFLSLRWMQVDAIDELRGPLRALTGEIAARYAPMGAGIGSYVPLFEQEAPRELLMANYVNHAHNEYAQWWLEAGVSAVAAMALGAVALALSLLGLLRQPAQVRGLGVTALVAIGAILAHSVVDYPLRTPAMLAVAAALAGIAAGQAVQAARTRNSAGGRERAGTAHRLQRDMTT
ncbi:O-antigen ligase family protein [Luteimonas sp. MC1895]|uniref:O-antigen ligase family protein n=1 Tax=Luteimonas sp. MC1895 TaxID=2819513 RepID=UPI0018F0B5BD|nr:O-antigen ligase family protein [Luteimonas sp. MC1895]MBJ6978106.1 O-antigen ligase family protein [Luteimonas sp. MC1895]